MDMGGSAQNTLLTCLGLADRYELLLVYGLSRESRMTKTERRTVLKKLAVARKKGVTVIPVASLVRKIDLFEDIRAFISIWKLIIREKPAIVHTHSSKAGLLGRMAAKIAGVPIIVHTPHGHVFYGHFSPATAKIFLFIERCMTLITDFTVALTKGEKNDYVKLSISHPENIVIIHSGVNIEQYMNVHVDRKDKKMSLGLNPDGLVVGTVG